MALLTFPVSPINGEIYPDPGISPVGTNIYQWSAAEQTWILLGKVTAVAAGTYGTPLEVPQFTVDPTGRLTFAQNIAIQLGDTTQVGLVQLVNDTTSNDATKALTAAQGYSLQQQITAISGADANDVQLLPTINGNTNVQSALEDAVYNITSTGNTAVITSSPTGLFNVEVRQASETQLGGAEVATQVEVNAGTDDSRFVTPLKLATYISGGQILATEIPLSPSINGNTNVQSALADAIYNVVSANASLTVSIAATGLVTLTSVSASDTLAGVVELATPAEVVTGTSATLAVTPAGVRDAAVYKSDFNAKGDLLSASANDTPLILSVGADGQVLRADSAAATGLAWFTVPAVTPTAIRNIDNISGSFNGTTTAFPLAIGGVAYTPVPTTNIAVFLGGVAQTPGAGNAYTVAGSTITFSSAPPTNTTFYAFTVN